MCNEMAACRNYPYVSRCLCFPWSPPRPRDADHERALVINNGVIISDGVNCMLQSLDHTIFLDELIRGGNAMYKVEILERKRLEKGLSYTEIAEKLGIHKVTVSRTLKGMTMKPRTVKLLADYLSVEMEGIVQ